MLAEIGFNQVQETKIALGRQSYNYEIDWFYYSIKMLLIWMLACKKPFQLSDPAFYCMLYYQIKQDS